MASTSRPIDIDLREVATQLREIREHEQRLRGETPSSSAVHLSTIQTQEEVDHFLVVTQRN